MRFINSNKELHRSDCKLWRHGRLVVGVVQKRIGGVLRQSNALTERNIANQPEPAHRVHHRKHVFMWENLLFLFLDIKMQVFLMGKLKPPLTNIQDTDTEGWIQRMAKKENFRQCIWQME